MRSGELFAGVGGLGMAVDEVFGSSPAWFAEFDAAPSKVLEHRHTGVPNHGDVTKVSTVEHVQILAGGFPCQDVSLAGRRRGMKDGTRSGLWSEFARLIDAVRPDWVVIENVRGLLSADASGGDMELCPWCVGDDQGLHTLRALGAVLGDLADLGFDAEWTGLRASDVGAPHGRFRVFILAWPSENTGRGGSGGRAEGQEPSRGDDASLGSDQGRDGGRADLRLMPTPVVTDSADSARHTTTTGRSHSGTSLTDAVRLLPTPVAQPSGNTPEDHLRKKPGREVVTDLAIMAENGLIGSGGRLLPTPEAKLASSGPDYARMNREGSGGDDLTTTIWRAGLHDPELTPESAMGFTDWGPYAEAIERWERVIGRPAPAPVRYDGKGGKPRLNPELTEWMMGWPAGHVTDPTIGLTRAEQLKACGNGVVPQQASAALRELLARPGVPPIKEAA